MPEISAVIIVRFRIDEVGPKLDRQVPPALLQNPCIVKWANFALAPQRLALALISSLRDRSHNFWRFPRPKIQQENTHRNATIYEKH